MTYQSGSFAVVIRFYHLVRVKEHISMFYSFPPIRKFQRFLIPLTPERHLTLFISGALVLAR